MTHYLLYLYAESPVHTGAADSAGVIDLPVQREAATGYPVIWGQSLKGALRQAAADSGWGKGVVTTVFGSEVGDVGEDGGTSPGSLSVGDAQLVAMPVPTLKRTFAWLTSVVALSRLARKYKVVTGTADALPRVPADAAVAASAGWSGDEVLGPCLAPFGAASAELAAWAERIAADALGWDDAVFGPFADKLRADLVAADLDLVSVLLTECTEQSVRVQLGPSKTVQNGPFYTEYLPAETILAASLTLRPPGDTPQHQEALGELLDGKLIQVGGDETIGKGLVWSRLLGGPAS